jgi:hypothetical protein
MAGGIFHIDAEGRLVELTEEAYDSEELLQSLLADYPALLAGDQIASDHPRRWLLVRREAGIPDQENGQDRWSVDHLFLDQDAIPTFVEVKRSTDTRIRREVVGQMLDYAANAVVYWPVERIQSEFERSCEEREEDASKQLALFLGEDAEPNRFWDHARTNLEAGRLRLLFVADRIPPELRRIVEFLNGQMERTEVLAVEIKQYTNEAGGRSLVPRVIGQTASSESAKKTVRAPGRSWDESSWLKDLELKAGAPAVAVARRLIAWAREEVGDDEPSWGNGASVGSFSVGFEHAGVRHVLVDVWSNGTASIRFMRLKKRSRAFAEDAPRRLLMDELNRIEGVSLRHPEKWPTFPLEALAPDEAMDQFFEIMRGVAQKIRER